MGERSVGIREMNQNSGRVLRSIRAGDRVVVTDHGMPRWVIAPYDEAGSRWDQLVAAGDVEPAANDDLDGVTARAARSGRSSDDLLEEIRGTH